jgi:FlaA1/EpsC-like NDP-sugar epimerase
MFRLFRHRALRWQLLLVLLEFLLLMASVYAAVGLRFWGGAGTQSVFGQAFPWRASLVAMVLVFSMASLGLYQVHLRASWLGRCSRQGVAFLLGGIVLTVLYYAVPPTYLGRGVLAIALLLGYLVLALWRVFFLSLVDADLFKRRVIC